MKNALQLRPDPAVRRAAHWLRLHLVTIWIVAVPLLLLAVGIRERAEIEAVLTTLRGANPSWLLIGVGVELLIVFSAVLTYRVILSRLGHVLPIPALTGMHMQRIVVGTLAPVSGPVSSFAFVRALNTRAVATHDALTMLALRSVATQIAFVVLLVTAMVVRGPVYGLSAGAVLLAIALVTIPLARRARVPMALGPWVWRRRLPRPVSRAMVHFAVRFRRHGIRPVDIVRPAIITVSARFAGILLLIVSLKAMGIDVTPRMLAITILAEAAAKVAMPFFHGIGVVEAATALALQQSGVPAEAAVGAALLWRGFEFWLPFGIALISQSAIFAGSRLPVIHFDARALVWGANLLTMVGLRRAVSSASEVS